jgi:hypothetical protein
VLNIRFPWRIERVGVALHLDVPLMFAYLLHADDLFSCGGVGEPPRFSRSVGKGARSEPASRFVGVTELCPPIQPSPDEAVKCRKRLATDDVTMGVRPSPSHGGEGPDEVFRRGTRSLFTEGRDLGCDGLEAGLAGRNLALGPCAMTPCMLAQSLS